MDHQEPSSPVSVGREIIECLSPAPPPLFPSFFFSVFFLCSTQLMGCQADLFLPAERRPLAVSSPDLVCFYTKCPFTESPLGIGSPPPDFPHKIVFPTLSLLLVFLSFFVAGLHVERVTGAVIRVRVAWEGFLCVRLQDFIPFPCNPYFMQKRELASIRKEGL